MIYAILPQTGVMRPPDYHSLADPRSERTYASTMFSSFSPCLVLGAGHVGPFIPTPDSSLSGLHSEPFHPLYPLTGSIFLPWQILPRMGCF